MPRMLGAALVALCALAVPAGAGTDFTTAWKAPEASQITLGQGQKVLVMVMTLHEDSRDGAEAALVQDLGRRGVEAIPAYTVIPANVVQDKDKARPYIDKTGCRYVLTMRVTGQEKELSGSGPMFAGPTYVAANYAFFYGGYYAFGWGSPWIPGNIELDNILHVETLLYDLGTDKLIWAGNSKTKNPDTALKLIKDIVNAMGKEMKKQGLIAK
jgi:hypothetical protein